MNSGRTDASGRTVRSEVRRIWNTNASFWDSRMGEGNAFHRTLLLPAIERLMELTPGASVLDVACGNGQLSRWMAQRGAQVVAIDVSEKQIEMAKGHADTGVGRIDYRVIDASEPGELEGLGNRDFDIIVCNMALMDMLEIEPLAGAIPHLLRHGGRFVFSVTHPCFNMSDMRRIATESEEGGVVSETFGIEIRRYLTQRTVRGLAMVGQPEPQLYFERPLSSLIAPFLAKGLVLNAFEEPAFPLREHSNAKWYDWENFPDIPPAIVVRFLRM